jgi:peptidoglycan hydrolase-like protein with peptidoglycan-binding domain
MKGGNVISVRMRGRWAGLGVAAAVTALAVASGTTAASASAGSVGSAASAGKTTAASAVAAPAYTPPKRTLKEGMTGADVKALQQRLAALKYYPGPIDGSFGNDTLEAVWAFQEVQGLAVDGLVGPATGRALVHPRTYRSNDPRQNGTRIEVNLKVRVLVLYENHQIALVSHVSTGGGYPFCDANGCSYAITPTGNYRTTVYMRGWVTVPLGEMYNPVFFISTVYAIHGDTDVPVNPVSHGCVRIPMDIAAFFHNLVKTPGTEVFIYN